MLTFDIAGAQIDGARDYQEDAFMVTRIGDLSAEVGATLAIVADGMGGHAAGNVASNMAVQSFNKHLAVHYATNPLSTVLREAVKQANQSIAETVRETAALKGMGCTLVAAVIDAEQLYWASVGDSHLYLLRGTELKKQNADHSYGGFLTRMAAQGRPIEPEAGFSRNMLMSALTGDEIADIDCPESPLTLLAGDRIVIASDGLDTLSTGKLASLLGAGSTAKTGVEALLNAVQEAKMPRQDNTTVIVLMVGEKAEFKPRPTTPRRLQDPPGQRLSQPSAQVPLAVTPAPRSGHPWLVLAAALLLTLGGGAWWFFGGASETARVAVLPPAPETSPAELPTLAASAPTPSAATALAASASATSAAPVPPTAAIESFADAMAGGHGPTLVWVPAGEFPMGAPESAAGFDERPQHNVKLARFAISTQEVSVAEYAKFTAATGHKPPRDSAHRGAKMPVTFVTWNDAWAYTRWLSAQTGKRYRLPSEAEWEYVARAGTSTPYWWGRGVGENRAQCFDCETGLNPRQPTTVGRFKPNPWGVFDTAGNVDEWVNDCYHSDYTGAPSDGSVFEGGDCGYRVIRGGAFSSTAKSLRVTAREKLAAASANDTVGIRVVREP